MLEPRFFPRADTDLPMTVVGPQGPIPARVLNLSEGGALVDVAGEFEKDATIRGVLQLGSTFVQICARVMRVTAGDNGTSQLGLSFVGLDADTAAAVEAFVKDSNNIAWDGTPGRLPREVAARLVPLIRRMARGVAQRLPSHVSIDDLVGAGFVALVELYAKNPFASLDELERIALPRIRWAMLDDVRNADPLSRRMRQRARRIAKTTRDMQHELGRAPTHAEVAARLGLSQEAYGAAVRLAQTSDATSLDAMEDFEVPDTQSAGPELDMHRTESIDRLRTALDALPPRLKRILELYYGDDLTLRQIGNILGVTEARISQLLSDAVRRLRSTCSDDSDAVAAAPRPAPVAKKARVSSKPAPARVAA